MIAFDEPEPGQRYTNRPGAYGVAYGAEGFLFLVRTKDGLEIPGGGIEPGESAEEALRREFLEETGHELEEVKPWLCIQQFLTQPVEDKFYHKYPIFYLVTLGRRLGPPFEQGHDPCWVRPEDALGQMAESGQEWIINCLLQEGGKDLFR